MLHEQIIKKNVDNKKFANDLQKPVLRTKEKHAKYKSKNTNDKKKG